MMRNEGRGMGCDGMGWDGGVGWGGYQSLFCWMQGPQLAAGRRSALPTCLPATN